MRLAIRSSVLIAAVVGSSPHARAEHASTAALDEAARSAIDLVYDGSTDTALARLAALSADSGGDPLIGYLEALAFVWKVEQRPESTALDEELLRRVNRALERADARLARDPGDARARLARGAAHGVASRLALFRVKRGEAAREAVRMREDLLAARVLDPTSKDALFGLGLYDYYGDVLPRMMKVVRFLARMPGGDRERGLRFIAEAEKDSVFHRSEVQAQLYEIYAFYEKDPDRALRPIRALRARYPGSPLWALKLAEHTRDRMGLFAESAAVAREILAAVERGHPNYAPVVGAMARLSLGDALLQDLRPAEARQVLLEITDVRDAPAIPPRARLLIGRSLELEGNREGAVAQYRLAAGASDRAVRRAAQDALGSPMPAGQVQGLQLLAEGRRLQEAGQEQEAASPYRRALTAWPECTEAAVRVAEDEIRQGRTGQLREIVRRVARDEHADPSWLRPLAHLLLGRLNDLGHDREAAVLEYKIVFQSPGGRNDFQSQAADGLLRPYTAPRDAPAAPAPPNHSR